MPNFSTYCFVYNNNSNNNNNTKYCNNYTTANKFLFIVLLLNIFVFSSTVTSSNVFQHTTETIEKCLIEDKDDLCLISRKNEFYYRWCNLETVERIHMILVKIYKVIIILQLIFRSFHYYTMK